MKFDIFISYKRKSLALANNLYYRLTVRGYSTFFDLEEMRRDNFSSQILECIEGAKDVFVILEEGSLDACKRGEWDKDWFCQEIAFALKQQKNIIPILVDGFSMPPVDQLPDDLKELSLKNAPEFTYSFFDAYLDKLVEKEYLLSTPTVQDKYTSVFKFYSNSNCNVFKEGKLVCNLEANSDEPFYLPVPRKGDYRFKCVNLDTDESIIRKESIDAEEEKEVELEWNTAKQPLKGDSFDINIGSISFKMIRVEGGSIRIGATSEQGVDAERDEYPDHSISLRSFYMGQFPVTQDLWQHVMGYNKSYFIQEENTLSLDAANHYPVESTSLDEVKEFIYRLSSMTHLTFSLPSEEEWEYAARGGQKSRGFKYAGSNSIDEVAWYADNSRGQTHPVGLKQPNELGLYDMSGNVWEWTETQAHAYGTVVSLGGGVYVRRGGSWWHEAKNCRVSKRYFSVPSKKTSGLGFRLVIRDIPSNRGAR